MATLADAEDALEAAEVALTAAADSLAAAAAVELSIASVLVVLTPVPLKNEDLDISTPGLKVVSRAYGLETSSDLSFVSLVLDLIHKLGVLLLK